MIGLEPQVSKYGHPQLCVKLDSCEVAKNISCACRKRESLRWEIMYLRQRKNQGVDVYVSLVLYGRIFCVGPASVLLCKSSSVTHPLTTAIARTVSRFPSIKKVCII